MAAPSLRTVMSSSMRWRNGLMGFSLIGVSCLEVGVLDPSILKTERPARHLISAGLIPRRSPARSALPRERFRSVARFRPFGESSTGARKCVSDRTEPRSPDAITT